MAKFVSEPFGCGFLRRLRTFFRRCLFLFALGALLVAGVRGRDELGGIFHALQDYLARFAAAARLEKEEETLPPAFPVTGKVVRGFGWQPDSSGWPRFHEGIELAVAKGSLVRAVLPGEVVRVGEDKVLGKVVVLSHGAGRSSLYGRLGGVAVVEGEAVARGQVLGVVAGDFFHFEMREGSRLVDPLAWLQQ